MSLPLLPNAGVGTVTHEGVAQHGSMPGMDPFSPALQPRFELVILTGMRIIGIFKYIETYRDSYILFKYEYIDIDCLFVQL